MRPEGKILLVEAVVASPGMGESSAAECSMRYFFQPVVEVDADATLKCRRNNASDA